MTRDVVAYLDHAATSPLRPEAREAMLPWLGERFGNPSGSHSISRRAVRVLDDARERVAAALGCEASEVVFTSGGTESDNLAIAGVLSAPSRSAGGRALCSAVEHPAVIESVRAAGGELVPVDGDGLIDLEAFAARVLAAPLAVASVMVVNNETGAIQPLGAAVRIVREHGRDALVHSDAVQAVALLDLGVVVGQVDLMSISGHKIGGPPGSGALVVRSRARARLSPLMRGGPQERELRAGTQNLPAIVGLAAALEETVKCRTASIERTRELGDALEAGVCAFEGVVPALGAEVPRSPAIRNVRVEGVEAEEMLIALDQLGVCASAGSACASGALEPSHVLLAMGRASSAARQHVRFSLGWDTTAEEIAAAVTAFGEALRRLRA